MKSVLVILTDSRDRGLPTFLKERVTATDEFEVDPYIIGGAALDTLLTTLVNLDLSKDDKHQVAVMFFFFFFFWGGAYVALLLI